MECPVCGKDCVQTADEILISLPHLFSPCVTCRGRFLDKNAPPPDTTIVPPCSCGKRFIDDVFAHLHRIMVEESVLQPDAPLIRVGTPLIHPGTALQHPPYLSQRSLLLLSKTATKACAGRIVTEVPEVRGVVQCSDFVPGAVDVDLQKPPRTYELLAGCDVRADVFPMSPVPIVIYKEQSKIHIEFPHARNPNLETVVKRVTYARPDMFVDALCGAGTLGIAAAFMGVRKIILNDAWYAAVFWAAFNIDLNKENLLISSMRLAEPYTSLAERPLVQETKKIAESTGEQQIEVFQGDFRNLQRIVPRDLRVLSAIDLFQKEDPDTNERILKEWRDNVGGEVFIP
ncbi:MAG: hypothetical protein LUQ13_02485 [Methanomicrobiales archaeon]|nr:hypothetical protein [Methanomicrobiales archaeon]